MRTPAALRTASFALVAVVLASAPSSGDHDDGLRDVVVEKKGEQIRSLVIELGVE